MGSLTQMNYALLHMDSKKLEGIFRKHLPLLLTSEPSFTEILLGLISFQHQLQFLPFYCLQCFKVDFSIICNFWGSFGCK